MKRYQITIDPVSIIIEDHHELLQDTSAFTVEGFYSGTSFTDAIMEFVHDAMQRVYNVCGEDVTIGQIDFGVLSVKEVEEDSE